MSVKVIESFRGGNGFLSNFLEKPILVDNRIFDSLEAAYQCEKAVEERKNEFLGIPANVAKRLGRAQPKPKNWDLRKVGIMKRLLRIKFSDVILRQRLLATGDAELIEGNWWHDEFWGICSCPKHGKGHIGAQI